MPSRHFQDMSSRSLEDVFSVTIFCLSRRLQDLFKTSWKTKNCHAEDVLKKSSRRLEDCYKDMFYVILARIIVPCNMLVKHDAKNIVGRSFFVQWFYEDKLLQILVTASGIMEMIQWFARLAA